MIRGVGWLLMVLFTAAAVAAGALYLLTDGTFELGRLSGDGPSRQPQPGEGVLVYPLR